MSAEQSDNNQHWHRSITAAVHLPKCNEIKILPKVLRLLKGSLHLSKVIINENCLYLAIAMK